MKINIVQKVSFFFFFILAGNVIVGFFIYQSHKKLSDSEQWVKHTEQVISLSDKILLLGVDLETASRGFIITNDSSFLEPLYSAEKIIFINIGNLRQLTQDNPGQQKRLDSLNFYIQKRLEFSLQSVDLRSKKGLAAAIANTSTKKGKIYTDRIRQITNDIQNEETTLLNQRRQSSDLFAARFNWVIMCMFLLIAIFTILLLIATIKNFIHSREKEKRAAELLIAHEEINSQSDEIAAQNEEYQQINEELNLTNFELIEARDKAEESDRLKSAFLANMSHEIRTPMNGILGFANLLKEKDITIEDQHEFINIIKDSGARMLNIINDIIDISKIESGIMNVNITETNINDQIEYIYNFFKPEVKDKGMHLLYNIDLISKEANIQTDKEKIFAILINLVKNAIKYSDKGSIEFGYKKKGDVLEFYVKDTGIGISKGMQKAVFDRFIQAEFIDHQAIQGAGLGLSISKAYVEMLGGKIWVESEVGYGSTFYFTIPYNLSPSKIIVIKDAFIPDKADNHIKKLKILIAEDDPTSEKLITRMVLKYCKEDLHARTGKEAVDICRNNHDLDFVLMDIQMPDMNGYEATRQIRLFNKDVIIIAQTAFGLTGDKEKSISAGCNDYISKPIDKDSLIGLIKKYSD
jgi:signal transduction histidine kinase/CheY-like chemotaxis protein